VEITDNVLVTGCGKKLVTSFIDVEIAYPFNVCPLNEIFAEDIGKYDFLSVIIERVELQNESFVQSLILICLTLFNFDVS